MILGGGGEFLRLEAQERIASHLSSAGDVRVAATLRLREFAGSYEEVWLEAPELAAFVRQLTSVVAARRGAAKLVSMSPGELEVELRSADGSGRFELHVRLGRQHRSGDSTREVVLAGGFELDAGQLPSILAGFESLARGSR